MPEQPADTIIIVLVEENHPRADKIQHRARKLL